MYGIWDYTLLPVVNLRGPVYCGYDVRITYARRLLWAMRLDRHHLLSWLAVLIPVVVLVLVPVVWVLETLFVRGE